MITLFIYLFPAFEPVNGTQAELCSSPLLGFMVYEIVMVYENWNRVPDQFRL